MIWSTWNLHTFGLVLIVNNQLSVYLYEKFVNSLKTFASFSKQNKTEDPVEINTSHY